MPPTRIITATTAAPAYDAIRTHRPLAWPGVREALWSSGIHVTAKPLAEITLQELSGVDCLVLHGCPTPGAMNLLNRLPCRLATFQDDLMADMPPWNPNVITEAQKATLAHVLEQSAAIVATTQPLADALGYPEKTIVQGNLEDFPGDGPPAGNPDRMGTACYVGGNSHAGDLELLNDLDWPGRTIIWSSCLPSARTAMYRNRQGGLEQRPDRERWGFVAPTMDVEQYRVWMDNLGPQVGIGLAPLVDNAFARAKSLLKFLEYTRLGWVSVVSDVPPYSSIPDDCCVMVSACASRIAPRGGIMANWTEAVAWASAAGEAIAYRACTWARENYSYQNQSESWVKTWQWVASKV